MGLYGVMEQVACTSWLKCNCGLYTLVNDMTVLDLIACFQLDLLLECLLITVSRARWCQRCHIACLGIK